MRNNLFYILIICAFTEILTKNERKAQKAATKEPVMHSSDFYENEAKEDIENLLMSIRNRDFSGEAEDESVSLSVPLSTKIMTRIDEVLKEANNKQSKLRFNARNNFVNFIRGDMQNVPLNLRNPTEIPDFYYSEAHNSQSLGLMNTLAHPNIGSVESRMRGRHNVNNLRNQVNIKPEVYPLLIKYEDYGSSGEDNKRLNDQYYSTDEIDTNNHNDHFIRTVPVSKNFDSTELLDQVHSERGEVILTPKEPDNNFRLHDLLNKFYSQSANHLIPGSPLENYHHYNDFHGNVESKNRHNSNNHFFSNVGDKVNPVTNERLGNFMKYLDIGKDLKNSPRTQGDDRGRRRRSLTQAGYTQNSDTCKTYNENLAILWSNLSKLLNVTEQPNDRALHNIAMVIQAYLDHQNVKEAPEKHKKKREGPKDKISLISHKIKKLLDGTEISSEKITDIILKYLKPDYTDAESEDCQEVNKEYLVTSVNLLYKNYLHNGACQGDEDGIARTKKQSLREKRGRTGNEDVGHTTLEVVNGDFKPEYETIHIDNELHNDYHKGKVPRQRPSNKNRRVFKSNKKRRSRPENRTGNQNENEKLNTRSESKSASKKLKKSALKSNSVKTKCEKYATRKLIISLRPVMERFMGLFECQLDNTLRSVSFNKDSYNPYYLYPSKFYSEEDISPKKMNSRSLIKDAARERNTSYKKKHITRDTSVERDQDDYMHDGENYAWVRKYSFDRIKSIHSATPVVARRTDDRESATDKNEQNGNSDYHTTYKEYFQSPALYYDYDGIYKTHKVTNLDGSTSLKNPLTTLTDMKTTRVKQSNKDLTVSSKALETENSDEYDETYYNEIFTEAPNSNVEQQTEDYIETPFLDLTKLRSDDEMIADKSKTHVKTYESITEFLKKARDSSLQSPEFAVPFALDTNKGYVELTHLIKYPKMLVYRPQFIVKNTMPYDDFLKTINNSNMTNDDVRLMKIVRHLPDSSVQVLFQTEDSEPPLEVRNLDENRRSGSPDPVENYQLESRIETDNENTDLTGRRSENLIPLDTNEARRLDFGGLIKLDISKSQPEELLFPHFESLRLNEELSAKFGNDSDSNSTSVSNSSFGPLPNMSSALLPSINPSSDSDKEEGSAVGSGSQIGSGTKLGLHTALNLGNKLNPTHESQWSSFFSKLFLSHPKSKRTKHSRLNSHSVSNSHSHSIRPKSDILQWWTKWKNIVKEKVKQIIGKMASFADEIDHIVRRT